MKLVIITERAGRRPCTGPTAASRGRHRRGACQGGACMYIYIYIYVYMYIERERDRERERARAIHIYIYIYPSELMCDIQGEPLV